MMWDEIVMPIALSIISGFVSWCVAKVSAKAEIKKLRETWAHEKESANDAEFDKMVSYVSMFLIRNSLDNAVNASRAIATYRAKANEKVAPAIDYLSDLFESPQQNLHRIKPTIDDIIKLKRAEGG